MVTTMAILAKGPARSAKLATIAKVLDLPYLQVSARRGTCVILDQTILQPISAIPQQMDTALQEQPSQPYAVTGITCSPMELASHAL